MAYKDRRRMIGWIGVGLLVAGLGAAVLGPVEMYCFYLFSGGGRLHFDGFGFGSLVFASIAWQIIGYYCIALVCIPLGLGHLKPRRWARTVSQAGIGAWWVVGIPLTLVTLGLLLSYKAMNVMGLILALGTCLLLYPGIPIVLGWFYRHRDVRMTFETLDPGPDWTERCPVPVLTLAMLLLFYWLIAHVPLFFGGAFPFFGVLLSGLPGIEMTTVVLMSFMVIIWGVASLKPSAWWGTLLLLCGLAAAIGLTLAPLSFQDIASPSLPAIEADVLRNVPLRGWHIALFLDLPLLVTIGLLFKVKSYFPVKNKQAIGPIE